MILNGKAEVDFIKWASYNYGEDSGNLAMMREVYGNALIIEWFDSIGIYVNVLRYGLSEPNKWIIIKSLCENNLDFIYSSRQQATEQAIKKANDIYNAKTS